MDPMEAVRAMLKCSTILFLQKNRFWDNLADSSGYENVNGFITQQVHVQNV